MVTIAKNKKEKFNLFKKGQIIINDIGTVSQFVIFNSIYIDNPMYSIPSLVLDSRSDKIEYYIEYYIFPNKELKAKYGTMAMSWRYIFVETKNYTPKSRFLDYLNLIEQIDKL